MSDLFEKLLIIRTPKIGPVRYAELISRFGSVSAVVESMNISDEFRDSIMQEMEFAHRNNIHYISDDSNLYPVGLRKLKKHPPVITVRGNTDTLSKQMVSIVGTRHATATGMTFVADIAQNSG